MIADWIAMSLRWIHVAAGLLGLVVLLVPLLCTKGSRTHKRSGKVFVWCSYMVGISGILSSLWWLTAPATRPEFHGRSASEVAALAPDVQFLFGLILFLGVVLLSSIRFAVRVLGAHRNSIGLNNWETLVWILAMNVVALGLLVVGVRTFLASGEVSKHFVFLVFPLIAVSDARAKWKFATLVGRSFKDCLRQHVDCMSGSAITFCTAATVFAGNRIYGDLIPSSLLIATFFAPAIIGIALNKCFSSQTIDRIVESQHQVRSGSARVTNPEPATDLENGS